MNILDEITVDFDLDSKILCDTPAKLKLREKTLKGIYFNLNDEDSTIPALMLAKKKKKKKEETDASESDGGNNNVFGDINVKDLEHAEVDSKYDLTKKLKVSQEKTEIFKEVGQEFTSMISSSSAEDSIVNEENDVNVIETYSTEEVSPIEEYNIEEPVVSVEETEIPQVSDEVSEVVVDEQVAEIPSEEIDYNLSQGEEGIVASVEAVEVPVIETVKDEKDIPVVFENVPTGTALDDAMKFEDFRKNVELVEEIRKLEDKEKEGIQILANEREKLQLVEKEIKDLDRTHEELQGQIIELKNYFESIVAKQFESNAKKRDMILGRIEADNAEVENVRNEFSQKEEVKKGMNELVEEDRNIFMNYQQMIQAVQPYENSEVYEQESTYKKVA